MNVLKNIFAFLLGLLVFFVSDAIFTSLLNILFSLILAIPFASTVLSFPSSPTFYATTGVVTASSVLTLKITTWVISKVATENKCEKKHGRDAFGYRDYDIIGITNHRIAYIKDLYLATSCRKYRKISGGFCNSSHS